MANIKLDSKGLIIEADSVFGEMFGISVQEIIGRTYQDFQLAHFKGLHEIDEKESVCITQPILVNVGRPHIAINDSDIGRWCLCLIPKRNSNGFRIEFTEALELFKDAARRIRA